MNEEWRAQWPVIELRTLKSQMSGRMCRFWSSPETEATADLDAKLFMLSALLERRPPWH